MLRNVWMVFALYKQVCHTYVDSVILDYKESVPQ